MELLASVERRYQARRPVAAAWHWRQSEPFERLPSGRALLIDSPIPFRLHYGFDGWRDVADTPSVPQGLGMHGIRFDPERLSAYKAIDFTLYFSESSSWEGMDHRIRLK